VSLAANLTAAERDAVKLRAIARKVGHARENPGDFFGFVMREETSRERIQTLPHQCVVFDFVQHYDRCVIRLPVGGSKTYTMSAMGMWELGQDPTERGAVISATKEQAAKPVGMVRDYIESSAELRLVFPYLRKSPREGDWWTQNRLVVERPPGIRDPSLVAVGVEGNLPGARLSWILVDDILDPENTATPAGRAKVRSWFNKVVLARRDIVGAKIVVTNTPYNPDDLTYALEKSGWPTLTMNVDGGINFSNANDFDTDDVRLSDLAEDDFGGECRLTAHDTDAYVSSSYGDSVPTNPERDVEDRVPLWPEKFGRKEIEKLRSEFPGVEFNQLYMCRCRDDESGRVQVEWIERAKTKARESNVTSFVSKWDERWPTFTGVDLGVGRKRSNDKTSLFTFAVRPDHLRQILKIERGRWSGETIVDKVIDAHQKFNSIVRVENNAAQDYLRQWVLARNIGVPIRPHTTGKNKADPRFGVESIFVEIENGAWLFPCDYSGHVLDEVQELIDDLLYYNPDGHTGDTLMAMWFAREQARASGALIRSNQGDASQMSPGGPAGIGGLLLR
jgi:hypothetical protein